LKKLSRHATENRIKLVYVRFNFKLINYDVTSLMQYVDVVH